MKDIRLLVAGGLNYVDGAEMMRVLDASHARYTLATLIHGDAAGADRMSGGWANLRFVPVEVYAIPATDQYLGPRAPMRRNQRMYDEGRPDMLCAFPGNNGTRDMVSRCIGKIPCLVGRYTSGTVQLPKPSIAGEAEVPITVQVGPTTIGWKLA